MEVYLRIDINIVALVLLAAVIFIASNRLDRKDLINKSFMRLSFIIMAELFIETLTCIVNKRPELWLIPITYVLHFCLYTIAPFLTLYAYLLIRDFIFFNNTLSKWKSIAIRIPVYINLVVAVISLKYHIMFYISDTNVYHRGSFYNMFVLITYTYLALSLNLVIRKRKQISKQEFVPILLFIILPSLGGFVQALFYGPLLMWSSAAFSLIIVYVFLQERMVHLDDLTGTWTRGSFEYYINNRINQKYKDTIAIIYCDVDDLKSINDRYGHVEGDEAILNTIKIIKETLHKKDIIVRMGGDEFIVILEQNSILKLEKVLTDFEIGFDEYNKNSGKKYKLGCSFGADFYNLNKGNFDDFLRHVDNLMYENKRRKKEKNRI